MSSQPDTTNFSSKISDYRFLTQIGVGSFGRVFKAKCKVIGANDECSTINCAVKCINKKSSPNISKIFTEVAIHIRLKHANILQLHKVIEDEANVYLVLELCSGGTMAQLVKQRAHNCTNFRRTSRDNLVQPVLPYSTIRSVVRQVCSGLDYLHRNDIVHRDLNLNNLLILTPPKDKDDDQLVVKIADFGLAIDLNSSKQLNHLSVKPHRDQLVIPMPAGTTICGTPGFISPEVWSQMQSVRPASDIFSLGSIIFSMIAGFTPKGELDLSRYSPLASDLITRLLAPDPTDRPSIDDILKHPFVIGSFTTCRLAPISKLTRTIELSIDEKRSVKLNFLKNQSSIEVSNDGRDIIVKNADGKSKSFTLEDLPSVHWKKYIYAWRFVELVKAKTPKVTVHWNNQSLLFENQNRNVLKGCLMENGDFEVTFSDVINNNNEKILVEDSFAVSKSSFHQKLFELKKKCQLIETQLAESARISGVETFPAVVGRRNKMKKQDLTNSVNPSSTFSNTLRSTTIKGVGVASQLTNGMIQVAFDDGTSLSLASDSQIFFRSKTGREQKFYKLDPLPEFVKTKLALMPQAIDELRHKKSQLLN